jgi:hypothetical protein
LVIGQPVTSGPFGPLAELLAEDAIDPLSDADDAARP